MRDDLLDQPIEQDSVREENSHTESEELTLSEWIFFKVILPAVAYAVGGIIALYLMGYLFR